MKTLKSIFLIFAFLGIAFISSGQSEDIKINTARLDGFIYGNKSGGIDTIIVPDVDSLGQYKVQNVKNPIGPLDAVNLRTLQGSAAAGVDSIPFNIATGDQDMYLSGLISYTTNFDGRYVRIQDSLQVSSNNYVNFNTLNDSIASLESQIGATVNFYRITLPINGTLAGSVAAATDVPPGWVLGSLGGNLTVNHNIGRYLANVRVKYNVSGDQYRHLKDFESGYSGLLDVDNNNLTIESISTFYTAAKLQIIISFE
jgi:hypothetical protein